MGRRVFLITKNSNQIEELKCVMDMDGHFLVGTGTNLEESFEAIQDESPHVLIFDMSGHSSGMIDSLGKIRKFDAKISIIISYDRPIDDYILSWCKEYNVNEYIRYPYNQEKVREVLRKVYGLDRTSNIGDVICVGYRPSTVEKKMFQKFRMNYLYYPSCHLAIDYFQRGNSQRLLFLLLNNSTGYYSRISDIENLKYQTREDRLKAKDEQPPWIKVLGLAQMKYQKHWEDPISDGLLPQYIPALQLKPNKRFLETVTPADFEQTKIALVESEKTFNQFQPTEASKQMPGLAIIESAMMMSKSMETVQESYPELFVDTEETEEKPVEKKEEQSEVTIEKVCVLPQVNKQKTNRMAIKQM